MNDPVVAEVGGLELRQSELDRMLTNIDNPSEEEVRAVIDQWVENALILNEYSSISDSAQLDISDKLQDYKASLVRYELENQWIQKNMDTSVSEKTLHDFYNENSKEFELKDFIVKVLYMKIPAVAPNIQKVEDWYLLRRDSDIDNIQKYAEKYALNFYYSQEKWIYFEDLLKEIPLEGIDEEKFILNKTKTNFEENGTIYYLNILQYKLKNSPSPFELERATIKQRILTQRIKELREKMHQKIVQDAKKKYEIQYFNR